MLIPENQNLIANKLDVLNLSNSECRGAHMCVNANISRSRCKVYTQKRPSVNLGLSSLMMMGMALDDTNNIICSKHTRQGMDMAPYNMYPICRGIDIYGDTCTDQCIHVHVQQIPCHRAVVPWEHVERARCEGGKYAEGRQRGPHLEVALIR